MNSSRITYEELLATKAGLDSGHFDRVVFRRVPGLRMEGWFLSAWTAAPRWLDRPFALLARSFCLTPERATR